MPDAVLRKPSPAAPASFTLLFDRDPRPMWLFDLQWLNVIDVNEAAIARFGHSRTEFLRLTIGDLISSRDLESFLRAIEPRECRGPRGARWEVMASDGRWVRRAVQVERFLHHGEATALVLFEADEATCSAADGTGGGEGAEGAERLSLRTDLAVEQPSAYRSKAQTEFLARLSHELRTPLNAVIGFSQLLASQDGGNDANQARYLEHILDAGRHLLLLVDDVLDLQRIDQRRVPLAPRPLDLASFIASETTMLMPLLAKQSLTLHNDVPPGILVNADERCLRQILLNLATNAIDFNRPRGAVRWSAGVARPGFALLMISDTGHGISREQIERLFQPFDRLGRETAHAGTGLGLLIARGLVEHMGGRLDIESGIGVGTQVLIELPLAEPHSIFGVLEDAPAQPPVPASSGNVSAPEPQPTGVQSNLMPSLRVLYVEDNRINALLFQAVLGARSDIELRIAETGREALDVVNQWVPDVLVLDANLPDMHGVRLLRQLRQIKALRATPAFMCSADAMEEDIRVALDAGFREYWTKPVDFNRVLGDLRGLSRGPNSLVAER